MPGGNRTGPMGQGPRTGRGAGDCGDRDEAGFTTAPGRRGFFGGRGGGAGRGRGRGFGAGRLRARIEALENRLARLEQKD